MVAAGEQWQYYEMGYVGPDLNKLKEYALGEAKKKGLEVMGMVEGYDDRGHKVTMRVRSKAGII